MERLESASASLTPITPHARNIEDSKKEGSAREGFHVPAETACAAAVLSGRPSPSCEVSSVLEARLGGRDSPFDFVFSPSSSFL